MMSPESRQASGQGLVFRSARRARDLLTRPTVVAQGISALGALVLISLLTRRLSVEAYGTYAAVFATYTFGNALVATTIGTRVMEAVSTSRTTRVELVLKRDVLAVVLCVVAAGGTAASIHPSASVAGWAAVGMLGILLTEVGNSYILGQQRYWLFCGAVLARMVLWVTATLVLLTTLAPGDRLAAALGATAVGALAPVGYLLMADGVRIVKSSATGPDAIVSAVGITNLALWLLASADRVILAHYALATLATYAALYGLLDRVFRGLANADIQFRLPAAFAGRVNGRMPDIASSRTMTAQILGLATISAAIAPILVSAISGGKYHPELAMSIVLSLGMAAMLAAVPSFVALLAAGRARTAAAVAIAAAFVNVTGNLILAPYFDTAGAAALTLCGYLIWLIGTRIAASRLDARSSTAGNTQELSEEMMESQL